MEIEKGVLLNENLCIRFVDQFDDPCLISASKAAVPFLKFNITVSRSAQFSQEDIKALLPYLQSFAETGGLEPIAESTLQGEIDRLTAELTAHDMRIGKLEQLLKEEENGKLDFALAKHIQELEQLVREWKKFGQASCDAQTSDMLLAKTIQLLGE